MTELLLEGVDVTHQTAVGPVRALRGLDLTVAPGEFVTVIGANGAGKSTLVNVIAGSVAPTAGRVSIGGRDLRGVAEHRRARQVARVFQDTHASVCAELTLYENLTIAATRRRRRSPLRLARDRRRLRVATEALDAYGSGMGARLHQQAGLLSGGQRQLVALTMAVLAEPDVLLLDEHTSALDPKIAAEVMVATDELVREQALTTVMITHQMTHAADYGSRLLIMGAGQIVDELAAEAPEREDEQALIARFRASVRDGLSDDMLA